MLLPLFELEINMEREVNKKKKTENAVWVWNTIDARTVVTFRPRFDMCFVFIWQFLLPIAFVDASESNFFFSLSVLATTNVWEADFRKLLMGLCHQTGIWMVLASVKNEYIKRENAHLNEWQIVNAQSHSTDTGTSTHLTVNRKWFRCHTIFFFNYIT